MSKYFLTHSADELDEAVEKVLSGQLYNERYTEGYNAGYQDGYNAAKVITLTITGSGDSTYCYVTIDGSKRYGAGTFEVNAGDTLTFGVYGRSTSYVGSVTIDGSTALSVTDRTTKTYDWTVPSGVSTISISMSYTSSSTTRRGVITVTTS